MPFREDILRGVRLFLIAFAVVLFAVWIYRMVSAPETKEAQQEGPALFEAAAPEQPADPAPVAEDSSEQHGLAVPEPPPVPGAHPVRAIPHSRGNVPPPPPLLRANAAAPPERKFEASTYSASPAAPAEQANTGTVPVSLETDNATQANADPIPEQPAVPSQAPAPVQKTQKGNRFLHALGRIFHVGGQPQGQSEGQKDKVQLTLQPKQP